MIAWLVFRKNKQVTTVFFTADCDAEYVRTSLINHDNYWPDIYVVRRHGQL